jgi:hypothetical protein
VQLQIRDDVARVIQGQQPDLSRAALAALAAGAPTQGDQTGWRRVRAGSRRLMKRRLAPGKGGRPPKAGPDARQSVLAFDPE